MPYSCFVIAAIVLLLVPGQAFAKKGYGSPAGLTGLLGHAALSAVPGGLWLAEEPRRILEAYGLTVGCAVLVAGYLILSRIQLMPASPAPAPAGAAQDPGAEATGSGPMSPFTMRDTLTAQGAQPR